MRPAAASSRQAARSVRCEVKRSLPNQRDHVASTYYSLLGAKRATNHRGPMIDAPGRGSAVPEVFLQDVFLLVLPLPPGDAMRSLMVLSLVIVVGSQAACDASKVSTDTCKTDITDFSSPAPGTLRMAGHFYADESVIITSSKLTQSVAGTPPTDRTNFTLGNLPSGEQSLHIKISCNGGQEDLGSVTVTVE
jgi:hypothetical protein